MAVRQICVQEITTINRTDSFTVTCTTPVYTPAGPGVPPETNCRLYNVALDLEPVATISYSYDVQMKYAFLLGGSTMEQFCDVFGQSGSITFDSNVGLCNCPESGSMTYSIVCDPASVTTTQDPDTVSGLVNVSFTVQNLCAQTIICIQDTPCS